jgi:hypothetical protein
MRCFWLYLRKQNVIFILKFVNVINLIAKWLLKNPKLQKPARIV